MRRRPCVGKAQPPAGMKALRPEFRERVWRSWLDGASTQRLRRKYSLTQTVVEWIIREHLRSMRRLEALT